MPDFNWKVGRAIFRALYDAGVSFESAKVVPAVVYALRVAGLLASQQLAPTEDERNWVIGFLLGCGCSQARVEEWADGLLDAGFRLRGPVTDEMVEAAAQAMFEEPGAIGDGYTWAEMVAEDPSRADIWRADARRVLEAAESARVPSLGGQS